MKTEILAIGRHEEILQTVLRLLNKNGQWNALGAITDDEAITVFDKGTIGIVLLCNGIDEDSENRLRTHFTQNNPAVIIIQHYGGGSGLLSNEIAEALNKRPV